MPSSLEVLVVFIQMWVGAGSKGEEFSPLHPAPCPSASFPMPNSQSHPICTKINDLSHKESNHGIHPRVAPTAG
ncbi:MAG: hypothetical protein KME55_27535 [Nostoc indistinguendum CM1-VF10]|nr:hypothetical protein [Nostoc indistinguendum CM1-VF10]